MHALQAAGYRVIAVAPADGYSQKIIDAGFACEAVAISGGGTNPFTELGSVYRLTRVFARHQVDLILSYTPKGNLYCALAGIFLGIPFLPNISGLGRSFIVRSWVSVVVQQLYRFTLKRAPWIFFQNGDDLQEFVRLGLIDEAQVVCIPGSGINLLRFVPAPMPSRSSVAPRFLLIARLMWDKGVGEYVQAARIVRARFPQAQFYLLGSCDVDNPSAISRATVQSWEDEGVISYSGQTDAVIPYIEEADAVVLPSYREGLPRTLLEGAALARPLIATNVPGCKDVVVDGVTGFLCKPRDGVDLAEAMFRLIALSVAERKAMGQRARAHVEEHFDQQIVINKYLEIVKRL
jgi:glycosyltransferase involved in cell wall biosynthesis